MKGNYSNPKCYANALNDCSKKSSREHYISNGLLKVLAGSDTLDVAGFLWIKGDSIKTKPSSLTATFLCKKHNEQLSDFDSEALKFFEHLRYKTPPKNEAITLNGDYFERWCLKLLVGITLLKHGKENTPDLKWLEILYRGRDFSAGEGIYIPKGGNRKGVYNEISVELFINKKKKALLGTHIQSGWFRCYFCVDPTEFPNGDFLYRPGFIGVEYPDQRRGIDLGWSGNGIAFKGEIPKHF